ncbi:MAG: glycosyltransferase [Acidobacteriota bacterium]|nr:glycosyltransferase [Acidobacteriota bacterium]
MPRRVCLISLLPLAATGGGERYSLGAAASVAAAGDECFVFSPEALCPPQAPLPRRLAARFVEVTPTPPHRRIRALDFRAVLDRIAVADIVLLHQFLTADLAFDVIANSGGSQILLFTTLGNEPLRALFQELYQPSPSHFFVEISRFAAERSRVFSPRAMAVSGGIWREDLRLAPPAAQSADRVCAVGRVLPHKGFEVTIDALPPGTRLSIVGPHDPASPYVEFLRGRAVGKPVEFLGRIDDPDRERILSSCRILVASSSTTLYTGEVLEQAELLGLVIFEALAQCCLPIASALPPFVEAMRNLGLGDWVYPQRDIAKLGELLRAAQALGSSEFLRIIDDARAELPRHYEWDTYWTRVTAACVSF